MPRSEESLAASFWSGRAWAQEGNQAAAKERWQRVVTQQPISYYAFASAKRLGDRPWTPAGAGDSVPRVASVDSAIARIVLLERLGMDVEARFEYDALDERRTDRRSVSRPRHTR